MLGHDDTAETEPTRNGRERALSCRPIEGAVHVGKITAISILRHLPKYFGKDLMVTLAHWHCPHSSAVTELTVSQRRKATPISRFVVYPTYQA